MVFNAYSVPLENLNWHHVKRFHYSIDVLVTFKEHAMNFSV
jgi:hypothetical protein